MTRLADRKHVMTESLGEMRPQTFHDNHETKYHHNTFVVFAMQINKYICHLMVTLCCDQASGQKTCYDRIRIPSCKY